MSSEYVIISSGPVNNAKYISRESKGAFVICTDGGIYNAARAGVSPNLVIGDFDSSDAKDASGEMITLPCEKDVTDTHAAVLHALSMGAEKIALLGATNGRADHYFANVAMLELINEAGAVGRIVDEQNVILLHPTGACKISENRYKYISVVALDEAVGPVTITGMKYPLSGRMLSRKNPIAISNEKTGDEGVIEIAQGRALVIFSNDGDKNYEK